MSLIRIEIHAQRDEASPLLKTLAHAGYDRVTAVEQAKLYFIQANNPTTEHIETLIAELLCDEVVETSVWREMTSGLVDTPHNDFQQIEVLYQPGVTDRSAFEIKQASRRLGLPELEVVTGRSYTLRGFFDDVDVAQKEALLTEMARSVLCNEVVEYFALGEIKPRFIAQQQGNGFVEQFQLTVSDDALIKLSQDRRLALNLAEMQVLREYCECENRTLSDAELEMIAQTWSEHCYHKTFRAHIDYTEKDPSGEVHKQEEISGLLNHYIRAATEALPKSWLRSVFVDNAGIIDFDDTYEVSFKVETHNHPSALEPFGGANTGVGGVIRDIIGVSARPIALTDVLCFGPQDSAPEAVPEGTLHPRRIQQGVVAGIGDYGNKMGIPTVNGSVVYDPGYIANPLVYCGCVGIAPKDLHITAPQVGDVIISLGGKTGRDGLKGATFSSLDLDRETSEASFASTAVQIGDPIVEKDVLEVVMHARDTRLYNAITDCGAGGFSSAVGEMAEALGAHVELADVALKYSGLRPWEIWLSEAQERIVLSVPPEKVADLLVLCEHYGVHHDKVGVMTGDKQMRVTYQGRDVVSLPMSLLHDGHPRLHLLAEWQPPQITVNEDYSALHPQKALLTFLRDTNVASKEAIVRTYDHEVLGGTVIKPFVGVKNHGPSDAAVIKPLGTQGTKGLVISSGINPRYGVTDPYQMAISAIDEAVRNAVAVGADPDTLAILDNFCWGNPHLPDRLGALVRCCQGCYDGALLYQTPFISGKDSLNNEYVGDDGVRQAIPGTLLISAIGLIEDITHAVTMDAKAPESNVFLLGLSHHEFGGSLLQHHYGLGNGVVPSAAPEGLVWARALHQAMKQGLVRACHDLSEGGLAVSAAEMCLAGGLGMTLTIPQEAHPIAWLFAESNARWLIEVAPEHTAPFQALFKEMPLVHIGTVTQEPVLRIGPALSVNVADLDKAWQGS